MLKRRLKDNAENIPPFKKNETVNRCLILSEAGRFMTDNFDVGAFVGEGSFGIVNKVKLKRAPECSGIAVKELTRSARLDAVLAEFRALRCTAGRFGVVDMYALVRIEDTFFIVMEHLPSENLEKIIEWMAPRDMMMYLYHIFSALGHTHSLGIVHNDVKPANIVFDRFRNRYLLIDFGLASFADEESRTQSEKAVCSEMTAHWPYDWAKWQRGKDSADEHCDNLVYANALDELLGDSCTERQAQPELSDCSESFRLGFYCHLFHRMLLADQCAEWATIVQAPLLELEELRDFLSLDMEGMELLELAEQNSAPSTAQLMRIVGRFDVCRCLGLGSLCTRCEEQQEFHSRSWGTRGFKAPEVELQVEWRNGGVDVWAVGVILFSMLLKRTTVFRPQKRVHSLVQLSRIFGQDALCTLAESNLRRLLIDDANGVDIFRLVLLHEYLTSESSSQQWSLERDCDMCRRLIFGNSEGLCICKKDQETFESLAEGFEKDLFRILTTTFSFCPVERNCAFDLAERCLQSLKRHSHSTVHHTQTQCSPAPALEVS